MLQQGSVDEIHHLWFDGCQRQPFATELVGVDHLVGACEAKALFGPILHRQTDNRNFGLQLASKEDGVDVVGIVAQAGEKGLGSFDPCGQEDGLLGGVALHDWNAVFFELVADFPGLFDNDEGY